MILYYFYIIVEIYTIYESHRRNDTTHPGAHPPPDSDIKGYATSPRIFFYFYFFEMLLSRLAYSLIFPYSTATLLLSRPISLDSACLLALPRLIVPQSSRCTFELYVKSPSLASWNRFWRTFLFGMIICTTGTFSSVTEPYLRIACAEPSYLRAY